MRSNTAAITCVVAEEETAYAGDGSEGENIRVLEKRHFPLGIQFYIPWASWRILHCERRFVAQELEIPLTVSINDLKEVFTTLLAHISAENQEKRTEVADYIPKLIQQFQQIHDANMFKHILSESEYESFSEYLKSLTPW